MARNNELLQIYYETTEVLHSEESLSLIEEESHGIVEEISGISPHILRCWACGKRTHFPDKCPNIHYKPSISMTLRNQTNVILRTHSKVRASIKSKKLINTERVGLSANYALK